MSTLSTPSIPASGLHVAKTAAVAVRKDKSGSVLSRLLTWYRLSVSSPATPQEKAEWQQTGF